MNLELPAETLESLRRFTTPTVSNAIEEFNLRPRNQGFLSPEIRCLFPELGVLVGYAVPARYAAEQLPARPASRAEFWKYLLEFPEPRVVVLQDLDQPPGVGAYFGEVQATLHRRLGCAGVVTNGCVRDLDEVRALGFHCFARGPCVSHAYVHLVDFGAPVKVGGTLVEPGALIHADQHGVLLVPREAAQGIPEAAARVAEKEKRILDLCGSDEFSLERLQELYESR